MSDMSDRLREARAAAGYESAAAGARALGVPFPTYAHHENGNRALKPDVAARYARFYRVRLEWLLTGRGAMRGGADTIIPLMGIVGAGSRVEMVEDAAAIDRIGEIGLPDLEHLGALVVKGESMWPRYLDGEIVLYDMRARTASELANRYCVVDLDDGTRLLKLSRRGRLAGTWRLESHNAPPEDDVRIRAVYRVEGMLER